MIAAVDVGDVASIIGSATTIALVALTYATVRSGRTSADAAAVSARLAEQQLQEAHRLLLVPENPREENDETVVPVRNIGIGPALRVYGHAQIRDDARRRERRPREPGERATILEPFPLNVVPGVAAGDMANLRFNAAGAPVRSFLGLKITFEDATGRSYTTEAHYDDLRTKGFAHVRVVEAIPHGSR